MRSGLACLLLAAPASADAVADQFAAFEARYRKSYATAAERARREAVFAASARAAAARGAGYGVTKFSDLTDAEFAARLLGGYRRRAGAAKRNATRVGASAPVTATTVDWRARGVVTPIKDQGHCGSCWAFSVVEQVESQAAQQGLVAEGTELSVQQMVDCDDFSHACAGGSPETAYDELTIGGGITTAAAYGAYIGNKTEKCHFDRSTAVVTAPDYPSYKAVDGEAAMLKQILKTPIAVCVQADLWKSYTGGVITATDGCGGQSPDSLNHCVQVVGVGAGSSDGGSTYWIVRNSWGADFGNAGYVYLATGGNVCGIASEASIATGLQKA